MRKSKWVYKVRGMPKKRLPAVADRAVWEKVANGRAGIRWASVVEKVWKDIGGNQAELFLSREKFGGYKTDVKERKKNKGKASAKEQGERGILKRCKAGEEKI